MDTITLLIQIDQLEAENKQLKKDAERYRWLRDKSDNAFVGIYKDALRGKEWVFGKKADELVDSGIQTSI